MKLTTQNLVRVAIFLLFVMNGFLFTEQSFGEDWRSDENVHRILSGRSDHAISMGLLPSDRRLDFAELCILHLRRHVAGDHLLTDHQLVNLLGWITRAGFNDAAIYLDALLVDDITSDRREGVINAIQRSMHEPTRVSAYTSIDEIQQSLITGALQTEEARLALAFALAVSNNKYGINYLRDGLINQLLTDETRSRIALTVVGANIAIPEAFEYCERMLNRDEFTFGRKVSAAYRLMQHGVGLAADWAESALKSSTEEHHNMLLSKGLVMNGRMQHLAGLVELLGSKYEFIAYPTRGHIADLFGDGNDLLGDVRRTSPADLKIQLMELIEADGDRLRWDAKKQRLIMNQDD